MYILILILTSLLNFSCSSRPPVNDSLPIQAWSNDLQEQEPYKYPFVASYKRGSKALVFVAIDHSTQVGSASFKTIRAVTAREDFDLFVAEGFPRSYGLSPQYMIERALKDGVDGTYKGEESNYTIALSQKHGVPFIGGEPEEVDIVNEIERRGYTKNDLLFYYLIRQIPQWRRQGELKNDSVVKMSEQFLNIWSLRLSISRSPNFETFKLWYQEKMHQSFSDDAITTETSAPYENGNLITHRISAEVGKIRDTFIVRTVINEMEKYPRIMIVYGGSHWIMQSKAWESFLGKPKVEKIFSD